MVTSCEQHNLYRKPPYNTAPPESFRKASRTPHICAPSHLNTVVDGYQTCSRKMAMMMSHAPMAESIGWDKTEQLAWFAWKKVLFLQGNTWVNPAYTPLHPRRRHPACGFSLHWLPESHALAARCKMHPKQVKTMHQDDSNASKTIEN